MKYVTKLKDKTFYQKLSEGRFRWQEEVVNEIYNSLCDFEPFAQLKSLDNAHERIVLTCGLPQGGKTELVLSLLGIKEDHMEEAYNITRAEQTVGKSSTSTAISYHRANHELFGVYFEEKNEINVHRNIEWTDKTDIVLKLKNIREHVEAGNKSLELVHLFFPNSFFNDSENNLMNIIDLPGVESSNRKEAAHVEKIANKYLPIASVILVVIPSNNIARLESSVLNDVLCNVIPSWKIDDNRFIIVPTRTFSLSSILNKSVEELDIENLCEEVKNTCIDQVFNHLGNRNMEIYPIEIGKTLRELKKYHHINKFGDDFIQSIREDCNKTNEALRNSISRHRTRAPLEVVLVWSKRADMIQKELLKEIELKEEKLNNILVEQKKYASRIDSVLLRAVENEKAYMISSNETLELLRYDYQEKTTTAKEMKTECIKALNNKFANYRNLKVLNRIHKEELPGYFNIICQYSTDMYHVMLDATSLKSVKRMSINDIFSSYEIEEKITDSFQGSLFKAKKDKCETAVISKTIEYLDLGILKLVAYQMQLISNYKEEMVAKSYDILSQKMKYKNQYADKMNNIIKLKGKIESLVTEKYKISLKVEEAKKIICQRKEFMEDAFQKEKKQLLNTLNDSSKEDEEVVFAYLLYNLISMDFADAILTK